MCAKAIVVVLVFMLSAVSAAASDKPLLIGIAVANTLDIVSTHIALNRLDTVEGNPLMRHGAASGLKSGVAALQVTAVHQLWSKGHRRAAVITALTLTAGYGAIAAHNMTVSR
jgi:hypothetical protein